MNHLIDPILSLAFTLHTNRGIYALLLGSGVSRSAGIPTSWEITMDLTRQLARALGEDCGSDPAAWYARRYGEPPNFGKLMISLTRSRAERCLLLRRYFEPSEEERDLGLKVPSPAHRMIAEMVEMGYVRVILTTNFDRLLEHALEERGVVPIVISTPDAVEGALPLTHAACTLVKLHGDYLDSRARIVQSDLDRYDARIERLLDRILDEFGLILCGWSAEWDTALRAALQRCRNHRFCAFWTVRGRPGGIAARLIRLRRAEVVRIKDADGFFLDLAEKLRALRDVSDAHPLTTKVAVARVKKYLESDLHRIRLHDLIMEEVEHAISLLSEEHFPTEGVPCNVEEFRRRVQRYEVLTEPLRAMFAIGCHWGHSGHSMLWAACLERLADVREDPTGLVTWSKLRSYPALLLLYAGGIAAVAAGHYETLGALLTRARARDGGKDRPICLKLNPGTVLSGETGWPIDLLARDHTAPVSESLFAAVHPSLREILSSEGRYEECFDRFEYLLGLAIFEARQAYSLFASAPAARFWSRVPGHMRRSPMKVIEEEVAAQGAEWPPLRDGLFAGDVERFLSLKGRFDDFILAARLRDPSPRAVGDDGP